VDERRPRLAVRQRQNGCAHTVIGGKRGSRCFTLEIRAREIDVLVQKGYLEPDARNDPYAIKTAPGQV
jgi:hypothetical protein